MKKRKVPTQYHPPQDADGNNLKVAPSESDGRWWLADKAHLADAVTTRIRAIRGRQTARREMYRFYAELYGVHEVTSLGLTNYDSTNVAFVQPKMPYNVVRRGVQTVLAKITQHKPLPLVMTERGDYKKTKRALGLSNFLAGAFYALDVFKEMRGIARDALVFGTGLVKISHNPGDELPRLERILPWEVLVDTADARYGKPKQIFFVRWMDRTVLRELYPDSADAITRASESSSGYVDDMPDYTQSADMILVTEAYRLPTSDGKRKVPGRVAIVIDGETLFEAPYDKPWFPVVAMKYADPVIGFWGDGLAAEMAGFQYEINYVIETLRMAHRVAGTGIWMVPDGGDVPDAHFENGVGFLMKYRQGFKPEYYNPEPASAQSYNWLKTLTVDAPASSGISSLSANAQKPAGITAAVALDAIQDVESTGMAVFEDAYESLAVEIADHLIDEFKDLAAEKPDLKLLVQQKRSLLAVDWADVDMARDVIQMQVWPTNLLGRTPAARRQAVSDLFNGGIIDRNRYLKLLDAPDIDEETDLTTAMQEVADQQIEAILDLDASENDNGGRSRLRLAKGYAKSRPDAYQDLVYAMHRAQQHICFGKLRGVPSPILDLLRTYIEDCKAEMDKPAQEAAKKAAAAAAAQAAQSQAQGALGAAPQLAPAPIAPPGGDPAGPAPGSTLAPQAAA